MNILEELWNGNLHPMEQMYFREGDFRRLVGIYEEHEKCLKASLDDIQRRDFHKLQDAVMEMQRISECGAFIAGFRLATQIMTASMASPLLGK